MKKAQAVSILAYAMSFLLLNLSPFIAHAGPHGSEFDLTLAPAAGGMEGVGIARPQGPVAMLFANPATLTQLNGSTAITLGATFADPKLRASGPPTDLFTGGAPFSQFTALTGSFNGESRITELAAPHAAAIQRLSPKLVVGFGFTAVSGLGSDFRDVANLPNILADLSLFGGNMTGAYQVTDNLSIGGTITVGIASLQAGLTDNSGTVHEFGLGGSVGATYDAGPLVVGLAYKEELAINYENVIQTLPDVFSDLELEQPRELQIGIATSEAMLKNTVIEIDFRYKNWDNANGYSSFWRDQYIISTGAQHKLATRFGNVYLRAGYSWNSKIGKKARNLDGTFGKITQVANPANLGGLIPFDPTMPPSATNQPPALPVTNTFLQLAQATIADGHWQQSISVGFGYDIPRTNIRLDVNTSFAFDGEAQFGPFHADGELFTAGMGLTWQFD